MSIYLKVQWNKRNPGKRNLSFMPNSTGIHVITHNNFTLPTSFSSIGSVQFSSVVFNHSGVQFSVFILIPKETSITVCLKSCTVKISVPFMVSRVNADFSVFLQ